MAMDVGENSKELHQLIILTDGTAGEAELHWYEAHGIGKKEIKIKYIL